MTPPKTINVKTFSNIKECNDYLLNKARKGEVVILDEVANEVRPRRITTFKKDKEMTYSHTLKGRVS